MWFPWQRIYTQRMSFHIKKKKILHLLVPFCLTLYKTFKWFFSPLTLMMDKSPLSEPVKWGQESYLFHRVIGKIKWNQGFPAGSYSQRICLQCGRSEFDPGWGRSLGEGHGNPLQYSCLKNPMDRGAWWATVHFSSGLQSTGSQRVKHDWSNLAHKISVDGDCSHEIKRHLLLGRKAMTNLDSILKNKDFTWLTKVHVVNFLIVMYGCENWTIKKAEHYGIDAFE